MTKSLTKSGRNNMRTKAIIIKKQNTNEYDQFVTCYTQEFGKLTAIAKSILKHSSIQAMHLDVLNLVEFELINGKAMPIIAGAQSENSYRDLKNSIPSLAVAHFFSEVIDKMVPELDKDEKLWDFMTNLLDKLNRFEPGLTFLRQKQFTLLGLLGYSPQCRAPRSRSCHGVEPQGLVPNGTYSTKHQCRHWDDRQRDISRPGLTSLDDAFEYNAGFRLKSLKFLHQVVKF
ncbi:MAG: DNA repair protein RecO [bacterium]|nr:DNA repair protein RecO [bacterium]